MATVYYAHWILLDTGELLENGAIAVTGNSIAAVGPRRTIRRESKDRVVNLGDALVLPGFINMHTHLEECVVRGLTPLADETFASFSAKKNNRVKQAPLEQVKTGMKLLVRELLAEGTTTILESSRFGYSSDVLAGEPLRAWIVHEAHAEDLAQEKSIIDSLTSRIASESNRIGIGVGFHTIYSLAPDTQKTLIDFATRNGYLWATHLAESAEELQAFSERKGDLYFHITRRKPWAFGDNTLGPMNAALTRNLIPSGGICFHCNYAGSHELSLLAVKRVFVVHCFRYSELLGHKRFPLDVARNRRMQLCLGTEGIMPMGGLSMLDELFALKNMYPHIPALEMLGWITRTAANALKMGHLLGTLTPGKRADILAVRFSHGPKDDLLEELIMSDVEMAMVMVDGQEIIVDY
jgi:cytosine/adenosine deaminase-related metal-dependent hydrolase